MATLQQIVRMAINDEDFRAALMKDPAKALENSGLTEQEIAMFVAAKGRNFNELLAKLQVDKRISKAGINPTGIDDW